ncbi:hypothetical protein [Achromobacter ruhlandii]|uniref:hypothetical protein n=1 Tax=Achromobacter ruhlandii TaxID=72557 RepID=UPI0009EDAEED|nr:hypothetical protein [Achromobacter ruhlandii]
MLRENILQAAGMEEVQRGGRRAIDVSYAPYFHATAKLIRDVAAAALATGKHKSARARLVMKVEALTLHAAGWQRGGVTQARYQARFSGDTANTVPDLQEGVEWAVSLLDGRTLLPRHVTVDERIAGLLRLERCIRGAAVLEAAQSEAGSVEPMVWTKFERLDRWLFEVSFRRPPDDWLPAAQGQDLLQTATEATVTAICGRPCATWSFSQFLRIALLVPILRPHGPIIEGMPMAAWGRASGEALEAEIARHQRAGGGIRLQDFHALLHEHVARCGSTHVEVVLIPGIRPIVLHAKAMGRSELDDALSSVAESAGINS